MASTLKYIEVENFKSYEGKLVIGPLKPFTAIIGPNGSGKSNFMDAISFVMGEKTQSLRVRKLSDLIHGASINRPVSRSASVTAVFIVNEGETTKEIIFRRSVQGSSSEYKINNELVGKNHYLGQLEKLKVNVKAKNFLVFQGEVESVAMKNPKEMTTLFEEISGSGSLKEEYDKMKFQMQKAQEELNYAYQKKKGLNAERRQASMEYDEAVEYLRLKDDLNDKLVKHRLFQLFHNERDIKTLEGEFKTKQKEVGKIEHKKEKAQKLLTDKKKENGKRRRELAKIEQDIREVEVQISKKSLQYIKAKENVSHMQNNLDRAIETLDKARKANEAHDDKIRKLEAELAVVETSKDAYEATIVRELQSQGRDVHLEDEQVREYHHLKEEAAKRSGRYIQELDSVNREQKSDQDKVDNVQRLRTEAENQHRRKWHEKEEMEKRIKKLADYVRMSESVVSQQQRLCKNLQSDVDSSKDRVRDLQEELDDVIQQLGDARTNKHEDYRRKKKQEVVECLKSNYPGVYDRMINMCHPSHQRYNVAITRVLGKNIEAIVVDTEDTGIQCIKYLKANMLETETFLPLGYIKVKSLNDSLRNIIDLNKGVKLLYDVLSFAPKVISKAVMFATNNALVCETPEDAEKVAYDLGGRYDAIALDGTFYHKSGIISGGSLDLALKAKCWDKKLMAQLKAQKEKLTEELREAMEMSRKESELNTVYSQIRGLITRLGYAKTDLESTTTQIKTVNTELSRLSEEITEFVPTLTEIEETMSNREQHIKKIKMEMNKVEDIVFSCFCKKIHVSDIRQYQDRELRAPEERKQKRLKFQKQINLITNNLEFERSRNTQNNVSRWERTVNDKQEKWELCKKEEQKQREEIDKELRQLDQLQAERLSKQQECYDIEFEVGTARREVETIAKDVQGVEKQVVSLESKIESKRNDRHNILMQCKMDVIAIPMLVGNIENIVQHHSPQTSSSCSTDNTVQQYETEARFQIDYTSLSEHLTDLEEEHDIEKYADKLLSSIKSLQDTLKNFQAPNMKALQKFQQVEEKLKSSNEEFESFRKQNKQAKQAFERIKQQRYERFTKCFNHVSNEIDNIYKSLAQNNSAQAFLGTENLEEPYLNGINYNCVAPDKRFQLMTNLSGGEKTIAALALLFAIHSYQPAPFFVLDEVDAALDNTNIRKVARYITEKAESLQTIVISLKEEFFKHADVLIGISPLPGNACLVSQVRTVDISKYPH